MVTLSDIQNKRAEILKLADKYGADNVRVFGSVVRGTAVEGSDLDLLVRMSPGRSLIDRIALMQDLEDILHIKVDIVNEKALHPFIRETVLKEGVAL
jgi:hypothetical protein